MTSLEQSFARVCAEHDLKCINISFHTGHERCFTVFAHAVAPGLLGDGSASTIGEALGCAITDLNARRGNVEPITLANEPLPSIAA